VVIETVQGDTARYAGARKNELDLNCTAALLELGETARCVRLSGSALYGATRRYWHVEAIASSSARSSSGRVVALARARVTPRA
jgi:hypothetical protein